MKRFTIAVTDRADTCARHGMHPTALDPFEAILGEPLKRRLPHFTVTISGGSG